MVHNRFIDLLRDEPEPHSRFAYIDPPFVLNAPTVSQFPPEVSGHYLLKSLCRRLGWPSLAGRRLLDFGCGVRLARTIVNLGIDIEPYTESTRTKAWSRGCVTIAMQSPPPEAIACRRLGSP